MANSMSPMQASKLATIAFTKNDTQEMPMANPGSLVGGGGVGGEEGDRFDQTTVLTLCIRKNRPVQTV